jgi:hypothetical protein
MMDGHHNKQLNAKQQMATIAISETLDFFDWLSPRLMGG